MQAPESIHLVHYDTLPDFIISEFLDDCMSLDVPIERHKVEHPVYAGVEEYLPTIITLYIAKPFFEAFLKKAGEDSYSSLKKSVVSLVQKANKLRVTMMSSGDKKVDPNYSFSRSICIYTKGANNQSIKFLIPDELSDQECFDAMDLLIESISSNSISIDPNERFIGNTVLVSYSKDDRKWSVYRSK